MTRNPAPATQADSNAVPHIEIEMGTPSAIEYPPQSGELLPEVANDFLDGSYALYNLYNEKSAEFDRVLVNTWMEHGRDLMVLSGLVSAAIAAFLAQSFISSLPSSQDVSAFYLSQIYELQAYSSNSSLSVLSEDFVQANLPIPIFPSDATHILWFCGLGTSLSSAVLSTLLQSWLRRYIALTRPQQSPRGLALIRAYVILRESLNSLQHMLDLLHLFLDIAIVTFLCGLTVLLFTSNLACSFVAYLILSFFTLWYLGTTFSSIRRKYAIYSTPLSRMMSRSTQNPLSILRSLFHKSPLNRSESPPRLKFKVNTFLRPNLLALDSADQVVEKLVEAHPLSLDTEIVARLLHSLHRDQDLERFLGSIPGFYDSGLVKQPNQVFQSFHEERVPRMILSFIHRTRSSATLTDDIKQKRIKLSLEVIELDPYLLERTFFHALFLPTKSTIFQCVDFILFADRFAGNANVNQDARLLAMCIVVIAITHLTACELDERWPPIVERLLNFRLSDATLGGQLGSMKLLNLVRLAEELNPPRLNSKYRDQILRTTLRAAGNFQVESVSSESQNKFCNLWNQLWNSAASAGNPGTNESLMLFEMHTIYNALHGGADDPPTNPDLAVAKDYPRCVDPTHPTSNPTAGVSTNVAQASGEASTITTPQDVTPVTNSEPRN